MTRSRHLLGLLLAAAICGPVVASGPSARPGVGAVPYSGSPSGVTFRTWAPNAESVNVAGTFNFWSQTTHPLFAEGNGYWSVDVPYIGAGSQYKFVVRRLGQTYLKNDPRARDLTSSSGNSIVYDPANFQWTTTGYQMPSWNDLVVYELHVGTFAVAAGGSVPANLDQAKAKLDYLKDLGVNAIQLMPIWEFPTDVSWGFNGCYPFSVESAYGLPGDLKEFIDAAHARGIAVLVDVIYNHLGPTDLDQWRFDGWYANSLGGIFFYNDYRAITPWGNTRPDFGRGEVRDYIRDSAMLFLEEFRADGLRFDGTKYIRKTDQFGEDIPEGWSLLQWINNDIDAVSPGKLIVAEDMDANEWLTKTTGAGGAGFDTQWCTRFFPDVRAAMITSQDSARDMNALRDSLAFNYNGQPLQRLIYTESHDECANGKQRLPEEIWPGNSGSWYSRKRSTLGAAMALTTAGIPMLFMGQEFLENGWWSDTDPLDWSKLQTYSGVHALYKDLIKIRRNLGGCTRGLTGPNTSVFHVNNTNKVLAMHRWMDGGPGDDVIVVFNCSNTNLSNYRIGLPRSGTWKVIFNSDWNGYSSDYVNWNCFDSGAQPIAWDGLPYSGLIGLGAYSCAIFSQGDCQWPVDPMPEDFDGDGAVSGSDLAAMLANWGSSGATDLDGSGATDGADLAQLLSAWTG